MSKIVKFHKTKENFLTYVVKNEDTYSTLFPYWHCGYIKVSKSDVRHLDIFNLEVHGGVTFNTWADFDKSLIIGFDCAHLSDSPQYSVRPKSVEYCINELDKISKQIKRAIIRGRRKLIKTKVHQLRQSKSIK